MVNIPENMKMKSDFERELAMIFFPPKKCGMEMMTIGNRINSLCRHGMHGATYDNVDVFRGANLP